MKSFGDLQARLLSWTQPKAFRRAYELRAGDELLATLHWEKKTLHHDAVGETHQGCWAIKNSRLLHPRVTVRAAETDAIQAVFTAHLNGKGTVHLRNQNEFLWLSTDFWGAEWGLFNSKRNPILQIIPNYGLIRASAEVNLQPEAFQYPELPLLAILGWYLMLEMNSEARRVYIASKPDATVNLSGSPHWDLFEE
jgi:hypothetical protein